MDTWFSGEPRPTTQQEGLGPRHTVQWVPRRLDALIATLDRLQLHHVYAEYWLAYRLDFDTRERIVAVENGFDGVKFERGQAVPSPSHVRSRAYDDEVRRARHGFVFYRQLANTIPIVRQLERHGYHRYRVGEYVVYAPPPRP